MIYSKKPGVDVKRIAGIASRSYGPGVVSGVGGFSGLFDPSVLGFRELVLAAGADGVGTKVKIAQALDKHDTVGIDLVAMNADDVVTCGARPLFFLDYIAVGKVRPGVVEEIVEGVVEGCRMAGCALLGGETATMPAMYEEGEYDLAGFCVGGAERGEVIDGSTIVPGDVVLGLESSGIHSNGYTTARRVLLDEGKMRLEDHVAELGRTLGEELLEPTRIYSKALVEAMKHVRLKGMAHVTEGGIPGNIRRVLPQGTEFLKTGRWPVPPIFDIIRKTGNLDDEEMDRVFNMGIGMVVVMTGADAGKLPSLLEEHGIKAHLIGEVVKA
ncbi:MAG: phosphoribosylformylglycinamidine cyclo-ligase [Bacillota bacterium]|jgi:phosphoribosylformylglycinamidine cyclo-ligase